MPGTPYVGDGVRATRAVRSHVGVVRPRWGHSAGPAVTLPRSHLLSSASSPWRSSRSIGRKINSLLSGCCSPRHSSLHCCPGGTGHGPDPPHHRARWVARHPPVTHCQEMGTQPCSPTQRGDAAEGLWGSGAKRAPSPSPGAEHCLPLGMGQAVLCSMMSGSDKGAQLRPACARGVNQIRAHLFLYSRKCKNK